MQRLFVVTAFAALAAPHARADLVINGDFETDDYTGWTRSGAVVVARDEDLRAIPPSGAVFGDFPSGHVTALFGSGQNPATGVLSQDIATVAGQEYALTFDYGKFFPAVGEQSLAVSVTDVGTTTSLLDATVSDTMGTGNLAVLFDPYSFRFTALGALTRLTFSDTSPVTFNTDGALDNVSVTAVPEPAGILVLGTCALGLLACGRDRRRVNPCSKAG